MPVKRLTGTGAGLKAKPRGAGDPQHGGAASERNPRCARKPTRGGKEAVAHGAGSPRLGTRSLGAGTTPSCPREGNEAAPEAQARGGLDRAVSPT